jgi:hypothetical protein
MINISWCKRQLQSWHPNFLKPQQCTIDRDAEWPKWILEYCSLNHT